MNDHERAEEHLKTIRRLMERATIYRAISAPTALVGGLLSLAACAICLKWYGQDNSADDAFYTPGYFVWLWLLVLILTAAANTIFIVIGANKRGEPVFSPSMKAALTALAPAFIAGAAFTFTFAGSWDLFVNLIMSIGWPLFYGLGLLATSHFAPRSLTLLGWAFLFSGVVGLIVFHFRDNLPFMPPLIGPNHLGIYFMAVTFGLFHLIYAACTWPRKGATSEP